MALRMTTLFCVITLSIVGKSHCDPENQAQPYLSKDVVFAEEMACRNSRLPYEVPFLKGNGGFVIKATLVSELNGKYTPGQQYRLDLVGLVTPYEGFIIQARDRWNEGLILGSFIPLDTSKAQTMHCLGNDHGTVTHNSKDPVSVQSFIWQAPPTLEGSGEVDFVYSVMQSSLQYWVRINASSPVLTYKEVQADGVSPMDAPCPSAPSPDAVYRFTATIPPNCTSNCDYFLGIRTNDNDPTYLDFMLEGSTTGWIGVGFAPAQAMVSADVLGCIMVITTGNLAIVDAWNLPASPDNNNVRDDIQNVCPHSASYSNGRIQCVFSRQIITNDTTQDVPMNGSYYLLYGRGEQPTGSSPPGLTFHGAQFIPPISENLIEPDTASNIPIPTHPCPSSPPPSAVYRFTATIPPNCVQSSCDYFLGIRTNDNDPTYLDFMLEGSTTGWIGVGFASAQAMASADVLGCIMVITTDSLAIVDAWNLPASPDNNNVRDDIQNVCPHSASYSNGRIQCVFSRQIITNDTTQDVPMNGSYYLLYGRGEIPTGSSPPGLTYHGAGFLPQRSKNKVNPATATGNTSTDEVYSVMVRVHGVAMIVGLSIFGVIGIFFAAWMKPVLTHGWWYKVHRAMMITSLFVGTFGFICIFVANRHNTFKGHDGLVLLSDPVDTAHFACGIVVMAMLMANPIIALFRCKPNAPRRWIYNLIHGVIVGLLFELLVLVNSGLGLYLLGGSAPMFFLYIFFAVFTFFMYVFLLVSTLFITEYRGGTPAVVRLVQLCMPTVQRWLCDGKPRPSQYREESVPLIGEEFRDGGRALVNAAIRWTALCLYVSIGVSVLVIVATMVTLTAVDS